MRIRGEMISAIRSFLGIEPSERLHVGLLDRKLAIALAKNTDWLESLKDRIRYLESHALRKKWQYEQARGDTKRILGGEIERLFRDLDRMQGQEIIISGNLDRISAARAKLQEYRAALVNGLDEEELGDVAIGLHAAFEELTVVDRTTAELVKMAYEAPQPRPVERLEVTTGLSAETIERLRQLET